MILNPVGSNMNEVEINGKSVLFSYKTPVSYTHLTLPTILLV